MLRRNVPRNILRHVRRTLPCKKLCRVTCAHGVRNMQAGGIFLCDPGKDSLSAHTFDAHANAENFLLEDLAGFFRELESGRRVRGELPFFRGRNQ